MEEREEGGGERENMEGRKEGRTEGSKLAV
jgi:hypothetical protein